MLQTKITAVLRVYPRKLHHWTIITVNANRVAKLRCKCGTRRELKLSLIRKHVKSCGCRKREAARTQIKKNRPSINPRLTHGGTTRDFRRLYWCYRRMISRTTNPNVAGYENYGGRGIRVCPEWLGPNGFPTWLRDLGPRPKGTSLDRIDVEKDYSAQNCRWADARTQRLNQRPRKKAA
jgi:hypothetical protein